MHFILKASMVILMLLSEFNFKHVYFSEALLVLEVEVSGRYDFYYIMNSQINWILCYNCIIMFWVCAFILMCKHYLEVW